VIGHRNHAMAKYFAATSAEVLAGNSFDVLISQGATLTLRIF